MTRAYSNDLRERVVLAVRAGGTCRSVARAMLRMEQSALAEASGVSTETIKRLERMTGELVGTRVATINALKITLQAAGVIFVDENGEGPGVRMKKKEQSS